MDGGDKRHIRSIYGRVSIVRVLLLALVACKTQASDAPALEAPPDALVVDAAPPAPRALEPTLEGEWERSTEPYKGLRIRVRGDDPAVATVSRSSVVGTERNPVRRAHLECQRSLWKPGDALVTGIHPVQGGGGGEWEGTILVRDWGFSGTCRHKDTRAPARITRKADGDLAIAVTRGKTIVQEWKRVE